MYDYELDNMVITHTYDNMPIVTQMITPDYDHSNQNMSTYKSSRSGQMGNSSSLGLAPIAPPWPPGKGASLPLHFNVGRSRGLPGTLPLKWRLKTSRETWKTLKAFISRIFQEGRKGEVNKGGVDNSVAFAKFVEPGPGASCTTVASRGGGSAPSLDPLPLNVGRSRGLPGTPLLKWRLKTSTETWTRISRTLKAFISRIYQEGLREGVNKGGVDNSAAFAKFVDSGPGAGCPTVASRGGGCAPCLDPSPLTSAARAAFPGPSS